MQNMHIYQIKLKKFPRSHWVPFGCEVEWGHGQIQFEEEEMEFKFSNEMREDEKKVEGIEGVEQPLKDVQQLGSEKKLQNRLGKKKPKKSSPLQQ